MSEESTPAGNWTWSRRWKVIRIALGVMVTLFIIALVVGVSVGLIGFQEKNTKGEDRYDVFYGQGLKASLAGAIWWTVAMLGLFFIVSTDTFSKYDNYMHMTFDAGRKEWVNDCQKICQNKANNWEW